MIKDAVISKCQNYRHILSRGWDSAKPSVLWIMLNPSTADHKKDDATIRRLISFTDKFGYGRFHVCNLFDYRTKSPAELKKAENPVSEHCDSFIGATAKMVDKVIIAWGNHGEYQKRAFKVRILLNNHGIKPYCLKDPNKTKLTDIGQPRHPLYLSKESELQEYYGGF